MSIGMAIGMASVTFIIGLIFAPRKVDCEHNDDDIMSLLPRSDSFREASLQRENIVLRSENNQLRWQYDRARAYGCRECCEHCHLLCEENKDREELSKIIKKMSLAQSTAQDLAEKLKV